jgi:hypothetical protein
LEEACHLIDRLKLTNLLSSRYICEYIQNQTPHHTLQCIY